MTPIENTDPIIDKLNKSLSLQIFLAIVLGALVGVYFPAFAIQLQWIGRLFVSVIEPFVPPVIFLSIVSVFGSLENLKVAGRITAKAVVYFTAVSIVAIVFGICSALIIKPGKIDRSLVEAIAPAKLIPTHYEGWLRVVMQNGMLLLFILAVVVGIFINRLAKRDQVVRVFEQLKSVVLRLLRYIFLLAPIVTFSGIAYTVGRFGLDTLLPIGKMLAGTYITMFLFVAVILGSVLAALKVNLYSYLGSIKNELLYALGTSSSSSVIPLLLEKLEKVGLKRPVVSLVTVTGNSLNLNGTCIYLGMAVIFLAQLYNVSFSWMELSGIVVIILLTSKGASGIPGTGFLALVTTIGSIHKIPVEGLAVLLSIDRFMSEARAITNTIGHAVAALIISRSES
ncbi:cation:dicarboxylate symporter family transporter [Pedobacter sp. CFBP9032]|uniref:cation:dicarboxylate symporter family transporter n=1 Tax=Pedobacter sp. CFBP9032 TaxID=3096539 RepID=UPI002A6ACBCF|nr:cation:dicarboxylase symporter family transporter [Pedobacter sp. CFBP9032]MDY0905539.1 cation:dicarboxylase symporter family transporter [Pedobacter sp. CFBP9032]